MKAHQVKNKLLNIMCHIVLYTDQVVTDCHDQINDHNACFLKVSREEIVFISYLN